MTDSSAQLHEPADKLRPQTIESHRAFVSLIEELEAADWYSQRVDATSDPELRSILEHNGNEEKEHAAMTLEWLRRRDPVLDRHLRRYLFTEAPIIEIEEAEEADGAEAESRNGELRIGALTDHTQNGSGS